MNAENTSKSTQSRTDRKEATRHRILMAALQLVEQGRSPSELGLREVARAAGMAAPSIYNHFADMDELGIALVDDCLVRIKTLARSARKDMEQDDIEVALDQLVQKFVQYINEYESVLRLLILQWFNPNPEYRRTIRREMSMMRQDFADNMQRTAVTKGMSDPEFSVESDAIFSLMITYILNVIDLDKSKRQDRLKLLKKQVLMVMMGSQLMRSAASRS